MLRGEKGEDEGQRLLDDMEGVLERFKAHVERTTEMDHLMNLQAMVQRVEDNAQIRALTLLQVHGMEAESEGAGMAFREEEDVVIIDSA
eukprot:CAMPEP_0177717196 /NCGR_PEP_ID=MMETSP0484_2-20121128/14906_1 /TAXON_ID=354590 /ORGANISM="Rhodomonas lens, Strain RHODO" /LENGTH=88 /DNA_ID=CAMNT_0019229261 /DNA_START=141 /DNA_END=404 /DNA_ORIENTATION=+